MEARMAKVYLEQYLGPVDFTFGLFEKFLVLCPEEIWKEEFGGWPVCLQYYHALAATGIMIASIGGVKAENPAPDSGELGESLDNQPDAADARVYLANLKNAFNETVARMDDEDLLKNNGPMTQKFGRNISNAETLEFIAAHMQYHLGACDGALRGKGVESVM